MGACGDDAATPTDTPPAGATAVEAKQPEPVPAGPERWIPEKALFVLRVEGFQHTPEKLDGLLSLLTGRSLSRLLQSEFGIARDDLRPASPFFLAAEPEQTPAAQSERRTETVSDGNALVGIFPAADAPRLAAYLANTRTDVVEADGAVAIGRGVKRLPVPAQGPEIARDLPKGDIAFRLRFGEALNTIDWGPIATGLALMPELKPLLDQLRAQFGYLETLEGAVSLRGGQWTLDLSLHVAPQSVLAGSGEPRGLAAPLSKLPHDFPIVLAVNVDGAAMRRAVLPFLVGLPAELETEPLRRALTPFEHVGVGGAIGIDLKPGALRIMSVVRVTDGEAFLDKYIETNILDPTVALGRFAVLADEEILGIRVRRIAIRAPEPAPTPLDDFLGGYLAFRALGASIDPTLLQADADLVHGTLPRRRYRSREITTDSRHVYVKYEARDESKDDEDVVHRFLPGVIELRGCPPPDHRLAKRYSRPKEPEGAGPFPVPLIASERKQFRRGLAWYRIDEDWALVEGGAPLLTGADFLWAYPSAARDDFPRKFSRLRRYGEEQPDLNFRLRPGVAERLNKRPPPGWVAVVSGGVVLGRAEWGRRFDEVGELYLDGESATSIAARLRQLPLNYKYEFLGRQGHSAPRKEAQQAMIDKLLGAGFGLSMFTVGEWVYLVAAGDSASVATVIQRAKSGEGSPPANMAGLLARNEEAGCMLRVDVDRLLADLREWTTQLGSSSQELPDFLREGAVGPVTLVGFATERSLQARLTVDSRLLERVRSLVDESRRSDAMTNASTIAILGDNDRAKIDEMIGEVEDPWGRPYRCEVNPDGDPKFFIVSAGPDGEFDTDDDVRTRY